MTVQSLYREVRQALGDLPGADPAFESALLIEQVFGVGREFLFSGRDAAASPENAAALRALCARRLDGEPLQYLLGEWEFFGLPFEVGPGVLIPRSETELLAEQALSFARSLHAPLLLDLCSGSGCIPIALGHALPAARVWGAELSAEAFAYFVRNLQRSGLKNVTPVQADVFALPDTLTCRLYDVITANPPYIASGALETLQKEVQREPALALDGGPDGLDFYRRLPGICLPLLRPGGALLLEIGDEQGAAVSALLREAGYHAVRILQDFFGLDRIAAGVRP